MLALYGITGFKMLENGDRLTSAQNIVQHMLQFSGADGVILHGDIGKRVKHALKTNELYITNMGSWLVIKGEPLLVLYKT